MGRRINPAVTLRPDRPSSVTSKRATVDVPATMGSGASCGELVGREEEVVADGEGFGLAARWRDGSASHSGISGDGGRSERRPGGETGSTSMHPADRRRSGNRSPLATHPGMSGAAPPSREAMQAAIEVDGDEGDWEEGGMIPHNPLSVAAAPLPCPRPPSSHSAHLPPCCPSESTPAPSSLRRCCGRTPRSATAWTTCCRRGIASAIAPCPSTQRSS